MRESLKFRLDDDDDVHLAHLSGAERPDGSRQRSPLLGRLSAPKENERDAERHEKQYADLTLRVTFVGRCTSRQIARVLLHSVPLQIGTYQNRHCAGGTRPREGSRAGSVVREGYRSFSLSLFRSLSFHQRPSALFTEVRAGAD